MLALKNFIEGSTNEQHEPERHLQWRFNEMKQTRSKQEKYKMIAIINNLINLTMIQSQSDQRRYVDNVLYPIGAYVLDIYYDEAYLDITQNIIMTIIAKIIEIAKLHTSNISLLSYISSLFKQIKKIFLQARPQSKYKNNGNSFYQTCRSVVFQMLKKSIQHSKKLIILDFYLPSSLALSLNMGPSNIKGQQQLRQLGCQLLANMFEYRDLKQRPYTYVSKKFGQLLFKQTGRSKETDAIIFQGLSTANYMLKSQSLNLNREGVDLIQYFICLYQQDHGKNYHVKQLIRQIRKLQVYNIYNIIFSNPKFCSAVLKKNRVFFRNFRRYTKQNQRALILMQAFSILDADKDFREFLLLEFNQQWSSHTRKKLTQYLDKMDPSAIPKQLCSLFKKISGGKQAVKQYLHMLQTLKKSNSIKDDQQLRRQLEHSVLRLKQHFKDYQKDDKRQIFTQSLRVIFEPVDVHSTFLFNTTIADKSLWHQQDLLFSEDLLLKYLFDHNVSQLVLNFIKEKQKQSLKFYIYVFDIFVKNAQVLPNNFLEIFMDGLVKVLQSCESALVDTFMMDIINIYKEKQIYDIKILREAFNKTNQGSFSSTRSIPSILFYKQSEPSLFHHPKQLKYYKEIKDIIYTAQNLPFRKEICNFIMNLYYNIKQETISMNGVSIFKQFLQEIIKQFLSCFHSFKQGTISITNMLGCLELALEGLGFSYSNIYIQHHQNVLNSLIELNVVNNINLNKSFKNIFSISKDCPFGTFFEDLQHSFRCQLEDIAVFQNKKYISPINYIYPIEDVLTEGTIILERNHLNPLKIPTIQQFQMSTILRGNFIRQATKVFNLFAVNGRMGVNQCLKYLNIATKKEHNISDKQVEDLVNFDSDKDGLINLQDFLRYYKHKLFQANFPQEELYLQLANLNIARDFQNRIFNCREKKNHMFDMIRVSHQYFYPALSWLANHSDSILSEKAQKLLLFLPSFPHFEITQDYLNFSTNSTFEIYYKLSQLANRLKIHIFRPNERQRYLLKSMISRAWLNQITQRFKNSKERYQVRILESCSSLIYTLYDQIRIKSQVGQVQNIFGNYSNGKQRYNTSIFSKAQNVKNPQDKSRNIFSRQSNLDTSNIWIQNWQDRRPSISRPNEIMKETKAIALGKGQSRKDLKNIKTQVQCCSFQSMPNKQCTFTTSETKGCTVGTSSARCSVSTAKSTTCPSGEK